MPLPETRSAAMPLLDGARLNMVLEINQSTEKSNFRLGAMLDHLLESSRWPYKGCMVREFAHNRGSFLLLLNAIPTEVRDSLILGTIVYDFYDPQRRPYSPDFPGVYAVGVAINGRNGKFLTRREIEALAASIDEYCQGWSAWTMCGGDATKMTPQESRSLNHCRAVDDAFGPVVHQDMRPMMIATPKCHQRACEYIVWLKKRADAALDPSGDVAQVQSPLYIGSSSRAISTGLARHNGGWLHGTTPLLSLTICCIKHSLGLIPETVGVPVLPTWEAGHVSFGEQLVTILASSLADDGGLNTLHPGITKGEANESAKHYVSTNDFLSENIQVTLDEMDLYKQLIIDDPDLLSSLIQSTEENVDDTLGKLDKLIKEYESVVNEYLSFGPAQHYGERGSGRCRRP
jgi:hypothetical protein